MSITRDDLARHEESVNKRIEQMERINLSADKRSVESTEAIRDCTKKITELLVHYDHTRKDIEDGKDRTGKLEDNQIKIDKRLSRVEDRQGGLLEVIKSIGIPIITIALLTWLGLKK